MQRDRPEENAQGAALRSAPPPPDGLQKAFASYSAGNLDEAERLCRTVVASRPDLFDAWHLLGVIQSGLGKSDRALTRYDRAVSLYPDSAEAPTNRGAALHDHGRFTQGAGEL
jgi:Tfp pilus assembly protein PilF